MQSPPDWPPASGALRPSPFPHPGLHALHRLARALLFPAYWALDRLLGRCAPAARPSGLRWLAAAAGAGAALLLLLLVGLPLALPGLPLWLLLQTWRRPFCYQPPPQRWAPPAPWRPPAEPARCFSFLSANLCLLPDGLARFSNLKHSQRRAEAAGAALLAGLRPSRYGATGCSPPRPGAPCGVLTAEVPAGLDFVCLQEVFDLRSAHRLVSRLAPSLGPVLYDVGSCGLQPGPHLKLLGSGLLLASRYPLLRAAFRPFPHARREDALASKGLLSTQVPAQPPRGASWPGRGLVWGRTGEGCWGRPWCCRRKWASWTGAASWASCTARTCMRQAVSPGDAIISARPGRLSSLRPKPLVHCPRPREPGGGSGPGRGGERASAELCVPAPAEDGPLRCKQLTLLLDWIEQFEAESRQSGEAVAFSVLLGDLNFDNCSLGAGRRRRGGAGRPGRAHQGPGRRGPAHQARASPRRGRAGAGAPALQPLPRPLPARPAPGSALGPGYGGARAGSQPGCGSRAAAAAETPPVARPPPGTMLTASTLRHSEACSPEMLRR